MVTTGAAPPSWTEYKGKGYTCSGSEYKGTAVPTNKTAEGCLAAAEKMTAQGVNYATYPGNGGCFVCAPIPVSPVLSRPLRWVVAQARWRETSRPS